MSTLASTTTFRASPRACGRLLPMSFPHGLLDLPPQFGHVVLRQPAWGEELIESTQVLELAPHGLAGDLAPADLGMLLHLLVQVVGDAEGQIGHRVRYVTTRI